LHLSNLGFQISSTRGFSFGLVVCGRGVRLYLNNAILQEFDLSLT